MTALRIFSTNKPTLRDHPSRAGLTQPTKAGPVWTGEVRFNEEWLTQPLRWKRPRMIFVCAHGDLFHESVPDEWIDRVFAVMALCPQHTFQVLTKRSARMRIYCQKLANEGGRRAALYTVLHDCAGRPSIAAAEKAMQRAIDMDWSQGFPNVWLGVSVEDQTRADERIPDLLSTPAAVRWISAEPLLGPVDLTRINEAGVEECFDSSPNAALPTLGGHIWTATRARLNSLTGHYWGEDLIDGKWEGWCGEHEQPSPGLGERGHFKPIDWIVCGGESGPGARPMHPDWARGLRDQCAAAGVPFFFKQWGLWLPGFDTCPPRCRGWRVIGNEGFANVGKKRAGRLLDGVTHDAFPHRSGEAQ